MRRDSRWASGGRVSTVPAASAGEAAPRRGPLRARASRCIHAGGRIGLMGWSEPRRKAAPPRGIGLPRTELRGSIPAPPSAAACTPVHRVPLASALLPVARTHVRLQHPLAEPQARRGDLEELVLAHPLERLLERHAVG